MSLETQAEFWTQQYLGLPLRPQGAVDLINELRDQHWTTDDWRQLLELLGEDPDQAGMLEESFNEGYEVGKEDGERDGIEKGEEDGREDGYREGTKDAEKKAKDQIDDLKKIIRECLPYLEKEARHPDRNALYVAPLITRILKVIK